MEIKNITTITTSKIIQIYKDNIIINLLDDSAF